MLITTAEKSGYYPSDYVEMLPDEVAAPAPAPIKPLPPPKVDKPVNSMVRRKEEEKKYKKLTLCAQGCLITF
jgi:hypothetical protein